MPLPVARVNQVALVQLQASGESAVMVQEEGWLEKLEVSDGQKVQKGQTLAVLSNRELEGKRNQAETEAKKARESVASSQKLMDESNETDLKSRLRSSNQDAKKKLLDAETALTNLDTRFKQLTLLAPCDGWVINAPRQEQLGKFFDHNQQVPFCTIGDPKLVRMAIPIKPAEYRRLKHDREALLAEGKDLPIIIRLKGRGTETWEGEWQPLPESEAKTIPYALSDKGGGPISVKPASVRDPYKLEPRDQQYLIYVTIKAPDEAVCPGTLGKVKIECRWRSAAWWVWYTLNDTFDLGLM